LRSLSIKARLLVFLLPALALLLVAAAGGLYSLQRTLLFQQFDRQMGRRTFSALRLLRTARGPRQDDGQAEADLEGLVFVELWDLSTRTPLAALPASHRPGGRPLVFVPDGSRRPVHRTVTLGNGRNVRVHAWRMRIPGRHRPQPSGGSRKAAPPEEDPQGPQDDRGNGRGSPGPPELPREGGTPRPRSAPGGSRIPRGDRLFVAAADLGPLYARLRQWALGLAGACAAGVLVVLVVVLVGVGRGLRPLRIVAADIATIDDRHLSRRIEASGSPSELLPVVRQLNAMLDRLAQAVRRERAFLAAAAHELRTPLAAVRSQVEVCLRRPRNQEEYRSTLAQCLDSTVSLEHMVNSLLALARLQGGHQQLRAEAVEVTSLIRDYQKQLRPLAEQRGLSVQPDLPERIDFVTDRQLLQGILSNLLSNAVTHADEGTWAKLLAHQVDGTLHLVISNPAGAIRADDVDRLFEPFWQKDEARSQAGTHAGIGLAVVKQCVEALQGDIEASLRGDATLEFAVHLPRCPDATPEP
jgi:signal transduction histidine kinase